MHRARLPYRRVVLPAVLAMVLAAETIAVAAAMNVTPTTAGPSPRSFVTQATRPDVREGARDGWLSAARSVVTRRDPRTRAEAPIVEDVAVPGAAPVRPSTAVANKAKSVSKVQPGASAGSASAGTSGGASSASLKGRNQMWFPALGISRSITGFACTSSAYPGDRVYRWGCAGRNNVYLFGHAHSVFKPLHDAYVRGRLAKGMKVMYADANGRVSTYKIAWWKVTTPTKGAFAYAAQSRPSMTLQTCVGARSQYRLIVRLVRV